MEEGLYFNKRWKTPHWWERILIALLWMAIVGQLLMFLPVYLFVYWKDRRDEQIRRSQRTD